MNFRNPISVLRKIKEIQRYENTDIYEKRDNQKIRHSEEFKRQFISIYCKKLKEIYRLSLSAFAMQTTTLKSQWSTKKKNICFLLMLQ